MMAIVSYSGEWCLVPGVEWELVDPCGWSKVFTKMGGSEKLQPKHWGTMCAIAQGYWATFAAYHLCHWEITMVINPFRWLLTPKNHPSIQATQQLNMPNKDGTALQKAKGVLYCWRPLCHDKEPWVVSKKAIEDWLIMVNIDFNNYD